MNRYLEARKLVEKVLREMALQSSKLTPTAADAKFYAKLPERVREALSYLVHNKDHVFRKGIRDRDMELALSLCGEKCNCTLYRGVSDSELKLMNSEMPVDYYTSFSESEKTASQFGSNVVAVRGAPHAFNYQRYQIWTFSCMDEEDYQQSDGDFMVETAREEQEWIMPFNQVYRATNGHFIVVGQEAVAGQNATRP